MACDKFSLNTGITIVLVCTSYFFHALLSNVHFGTTSKQCARKIVKLKWLKLELCFTSTGWYQSPVGQYDQAGLIRFPQQQLKLHPGVMFPMSGAPRKRAKLASSRVGLVPGNQPNDPQVCLIQRNEYTAEELFQRSLGNRIKI